MFQASLRPPHSAGRPRPLRTLSFAVALVAGALFPSLAARAQVLTGTVTDGEFGGGLPGANVSVFPAGGTAPVGGSSTDLDGRYRIANLTPGQYDVAFTFIGYATQRVTGVALTAGATQTLDVTLAEEEAVDIGQEVVVTAEAIASNTEASILAVQSRAPAILDGVSAQQIRRTPDSNTGDALRRVTGVTVSGGGRFVLVRGVPERYNATLLNGTPVPSTEPDRRAFAYDLIPSNLLDNVLVSKSATPDLPGDFAGGVLQLNTRDFVESLTGSASVSASVSNATGSSLLLGPRTSLPGSFPASSIGGADVTDAQRAEFGRMLGNGVRLDEQTGDPTPNFAFSLGESAETPIGRIGGIGAVNYRSGYALADITRREFEAAGTTRFDYAGQQFGYFRTAGGLLNLSYRPTGQQSFSFKNFYTWTADDEVTQLNGIQSSDLNAELRQTAIRYLSRTLYSGQLGGDHFLAGIGQGGSRVAWNLFRSTTQRDEPDYRRIVYFRQLDAEEGTPFAAFVGPNVSLSGGGRFFSELDEVSTGATLRSEVPLGGGVQVTFGGLVELRDRDFTSRLLGLTTPRNPSNFNFDLLALPIDSLFLPQNFGRLDRAGCENGGRGCEGFVLGELQSSGSDYTASQDLYAGFAMVDTRLRFLSPNLRFVGGARVERAVQKVRSLSAQGDSVQVNAPYTNLLPSFNLRYAFSDRTNLRLAYSRNLNRPELRELAPFQYYDFELQTTVYGNDSLRQASINNFDLRLETYPGSGEILALSVFYKRFTDPIELAVVPGVGLNAERSFTNAEYANNLGFELEARHGLGFLTPYLAGSSVLANYTYTDSNVETLGSETVLARSGRPLQGQSAYVINLGFNFVEPTLGTALSVLYNRLGSRIVEVATVSEADVVEAPRDVIDVVLTQPLLRRYELRFTARDLLNQSQRFEQEGLLTRENLRGRQISIGVSARI